MTSSAPVTALSKISCSFPDLPRSSQVMPQRVLKSSSPTEVRATSMHSSSMCTNPYLLARSTRITAMESLRRSLSFTTLSFLACCRLVPKAFSPLNLLLGAEWVARGQADGRIFLSLGFVLVPENVLHFSSVTSSENSQHAAQSV